MITVLADDLTGACEIAGMAHQQGLRATVHLVGSGDDSFVEGPTSPRSEETGVRVIDTETRLLSAAAAAARLRQLLPALSLSGPASVFKKTDSVLRGPLCAELETLAEVLGTRRALLVPANPLLRRTVTNGLYTINGTPLAETVFATDPFHPAKSSDVRALLAGSAQWSIFTAVSTEQLPAAGIVVGDAAREEDLKGWAQRAWSDSLLAAGSSAFFDAWLRTRPQHTPSSASSTSASASAEAQLPSRLLLLSGTTAAPQRKAMSTCGWAAGLSVNRLTESPAWCSRVMDLLKAHSRAAAYIDGPVRNDPRISAAITELFSELACVATKAGDPTHLVVEGGATAAAVAMSLCWRELEVLHVWAPGVVSLTPIASRQHVITMKPGSYPWPATISAMLFSPTTTPDACS
jgi:D-threonate/D-erythronate kinase